MTWAHSAAVCLYRRTLAGNVSCGDVNVNCKNLRALRVSPPRDAESAEDAEARTDAKRLLVLKNIKNWALRALRRELSI